MPSRARASSTRALPRGKWWNSSRRLRNFNTEMSSTASARPSKYRSAKHACMRGISSSSSSDCSCTGRSIAVGL
jgi:hypothetical protein